MDPEDRDEGIFTISETMPVPELFEPLVGCESKYGRMVSRLLALVLAAAIIDLWFVTIYLTNRAFAPKPPAPTRIVGRSGNSHDVNAAEHKTEIEPTDPPRRVDGPADHRRSLPLDSGTGGVTRSHRWVFDFEADQEEDDYARLLDTLKIELATPIGGKSLAYASNFTTSPINRSALSRLEQRIYLSWSNVSHRRHDLALLRKAGVKVADNAIIFQLLPENVVDHLAQLEYEYKDRPPDRIRRTQFKVVPSGRTFDFQVTSQEELDPSRISPRIHRLSY